MTTQDRLRKIASTLRNQNRAEQQGRTEKIAKILYTATSLQLLKNKLFERVS